ncbi:MAG: hypothetical protein R3C52_12160 [Hyphomonadaceae bacterium]
MDDRPFGPAHDRADMSAADDPDREILIETLRMGHGMEVRAVSGGDGLEVVFVAPARATPHELEALARMKLAYVRRKSEGDADGSGEGGTGGTGGGRGIIV